MPQALWEYRKVPGTKLSDYVGVNGANKPAWWEPGLIGNENTLGIYTNWNGATLDRRTSTFYWACAGGHEGYHGNQVFGIRCEVGSPAYVELRGPTPWAQISPNYGVQYTAARYGDGRPVARHTYYNTQIIERRGWICLFGTNAPSSGNGQFSNSTWYRQCDAFNIVNGDWEPAGTIPNRNVVNWGPNFDEAVCKHPITEDVYVWRATDLNRWNQSTNTWTNVSNNGVPNIARHATAIDDRRNRILALGGQHNQGGASGTWTVDLSTFASTQRTLTGNAAGVSFLTAAGDGYGLCFVKYPDPADDCFFARGKYAGAAFYRINATTFVVDAPTPIGGTDIPLASNTNNNPIYNRWDYAPRLGSILYAVSYDQEIRALRVR